MANAGTHARLAYLGLAGSRAALLATTPASRRAAREFDRWMSQGELDRETYDELQRVLAAVESA